MTAEKAWVPTQGWCRSSGQSEQGCLSKGYLNNTVTCFHIISWISEQGTSCQQPPPSCLLFSWNSVMMSLGSSSRRFSTSWMTMSNLPALNQCLILLMLWILFSRYTEEMKTNLRVSPGNNLRASSCICGLLFVKSLLRSLMPIHLRRNLQNWWRLSRAWYRKTPIVCIDGSDTKLWGDLPLIFPTIWEEFERKFLFSFFKYLFSTRYSDHCHLPLPRKVCCLYPLPHLTTAFLSGIKDFYCVLVLLPFMHV